MGGFFGRIAPELERLIWRRVSHPVLRVAFEQATGMSPEEWERRWRADEIEDTAENMRLAIRALALCASADLAQLAAGDVAPDPVGR